MEGEGEGEEVRCQSVSQSTFSMALRERSRNPGTPARFANIPGSMPVMPWLAICPPPMTVVRCWPELEPFGFTKDKTDTTTTKKSKLSFPLHKDAPRSFVIKDQKLQRTTHHSTLEFVIKDRNVTKDKTIVQSNARQKYHWCRGSGSPTKATRG